MVSAIVIQIMDSQVYLHSAKIVGNRIKRFRKGLAYHATQVQYSMDKRACAMQQMVMAIMREPVQNVRSYRRPSSVEYASLAAKDQPSRTMSVCAIKPRDM
ncbi:Hypothetical_protein [Hexamita inflata]|uniref:Hypothetical_protein n=1 Tax=Hexamita inflata TaxID=28002 RepID=A0AA86PL57_9EUKA|nr:Hypothetical protein HINF_LOCUS24849 [Hexamita inflata]